MKFLCLIRAEKVMEQMPETAAAKHFEAYREFTAAIRGSGHFVGCNRLLPPKAATTVRVRDGKASTTDGPYAETKEQLGGYYVIEARDLDEATGWRRRSPGRGSDRSRCADRGGRTDAPRARLPTRLKRAT